MPWFIKRGYHIKSILHFPIKPLGVYISVHMGLCVCMFKRGGKYYEGRDKTHIIYLSL